MSWNNSTLSNGDDYCHSTYKLYHIFVEKFINSIGLIFNILNIIVFNKLIKSKGVKGDMFKYLLFKSMFDAYYNFRNLLFIIYDCKHCLINRSAQYLIFHWIFVIYLGYVGQLLSIFCEIGATYDRYQQISKRLKFFKRISYKYYLFIVFIYSLIFYLYKFFDRTLSIRSGTSNEYILKFNSFGHSELALKIDFVHSFIKNGLCVIVILVLNVLTFLSIKKTMNHKRSLINKCDNKSENETLRRSKSMAKLKCVKVEINISLMILTTGILTIIGHGFLFVYNFPFMIKYANFCLYSITNLLYYLSVTFNFLIYFAFYKNFRVCFKNMLIFGISYKGL